ncbi:uncharacterized protein LOC110604045 [Manihot esculenta]|uniref:uncharacterized protein LOC110604045 n=1 Tax=Manihot esculenta TaxID=3983 RepID=UPI000B5D188A|nr:uncharacterized protein LOC110604045 [Manihot esculenta]
MDLAGVFINRFIAGVPTKRKTSYLKTVRQRRNKSLREYIARFNLEALQIRKLDEARAIETMQKGTTSLEFFGLLCRKPPTTLVELMKRVKKYIRQDDALTTSRFAKKAGDIGKDGEDKRSDRLKRRQDQGPEALNRHRWERNEQRPYQPQIPEVITSLNVSRAEVLVAVQDKDFIQWPKPMKAEANRRDLDKYCQYLRTHGHDINDCYQLINKIERHIKRGHLRNFMKKPEGHRPEHNVMEEKPRRQIGGPMNNGSNRIINMIVRGTRGKKISRNGEGSS